MDIKEDTILKFIKGECTQSEEKIILEKAATSPLFKQELINLKQIYISQTLPQQLAGNAELKEFKNYIKLKEDNKCSHTLYFNHIKKILRWMVAASIVVLLILNLKYKVFTVPEKNIVPIASINKDNLSVLYTAKGVKGEAILPDGSKVILNSDSKITYPSNFYGDTREVIFSGEGYFEVKKDSLHPMIIHCNKNFRVEVYGTTFNIKSYDNDNIASTTLFNGSIRIVEEKKGKEYPIDIVPNQSYVIKQNENITIVKKEEDADKICEWKEGKLSFDSTPLCEAITILERWHGVHFIVTNSSLNQVPITANFTTESVFQIMELLKFSTDINYEIKDNIIIIK